MTFHVTVTNGKAKSVPHPNLLINRVPGEQTEYFVREIRPTHGRFAEKADKIRLQGQYHVVAIPLSRIYRNLSLLSLLQSRFVSDMVFRSIGADFHSDNTVSAPLLHILWVIWLGLRGSDEKVCSHFSALSQQTNITSSTNLY
jgi:hypothetical protein